MDIEILEKAKNLYLDRVEITMGDDTDSDESKRAFKEAMEVCDRIIQMEKIESAEREQQMKIEAAEREQQMKIEAAERDKQLKPLNDIVVPLVKEGTKFMLYAGFAIWLTRYERDEIVTGTGPKNLFSNLLRPKI